MYVTCDVCGGKRFDKETLTVKWGGHSVGGAEKGAKKDDKKNRLNIYEVLQLTIEEAIVFFQDIPTIYDRLKTLMDVGLG